MTLARPRRKSKSVLYLLAGLLLASGTIRIGDSVGQAFAASGAQPEDGQEHAAGVEECLPLAEAEALLQAFAGREEQLSLRESQFETRMQTLKVAEEQIEMRLAELSAARESLAATLAIAETAAETDVDQLTQVYQNMKPRDAADLFAEMSPDFAAGFLGRMRPDAAAAILAGLEPSTAYSISVHLAGRNANAPTQ